MNSRGKTAIITGGSKGIGAACADLFYREGYNVAILDVVPPEDNRVDGWFYKACDVASDIQVKKSIEDVYDAFGSIGVLINNAAIQRYGTVTETTGAEWDHVMNVNLKSAFLCSKYAIPYMLQAGSGVVINVASVQAFLSQQKVAAYTTAKSALLGLTRSIAVDYSPAIRSVAVCPGTIDTPMLREALALSPDPDIVMQECIDMHLTKRIGSPEEVAELILFLCSSKASFITGQAIRIDGGLGITIQGSKRDAK